MITILRIEGRWNDTLSPDLKSATDRRLPTTKTAADKRYCICLGENTIKKAVAIGNKISVNSIFASLLGANFEDYNT